MLRQIYQTDIYKPDLLPDGALNFLAISVFSLLSIGTDAQPANKDIATAVTISIFFIACSYIA